MGQENVSSNDVHRLFIQTVLSRRTVSDKLAHIIWRKCIQAVKTANPTLEIETPENDDGWNQFEDKIQNILDPFDLEFKATTDELSGKKVYTILNRKGDDVAQMASNYSPVEIAYFKAVVEQIVYAPNMTYSLSALAALREVSFLKSGSMTKTQAEHVLGSFVARGWLVRSKRGRYSLGSRTILELNQYLQERYGEELKECTLCTEIVTKGIKCATDKCNVFLHTHCHERYKRSRQICPSCQQPWGNNGSGIRIIGEKAAREQDDRRRARRSDAGVSDEDPEDSMYDNTQQSQGWSQSQSQSQSQAQSQSQSQSQSQKGGRKVRASTKKAANGRAKKRYSKKESDDEEDEAVATDGGDNDDDAMNIDDGSEIEDKPVRKTSRRHK